MITNFYFLRHGSVLQAAVSVLSPRQSVPSLIASVSTSLVLCLDPTPQVELQVGHSVQIDQTQGQGCSLNLYVIFQYIYGRLYLQFYLLHSPFPLIGNLIFLLLQFDVLLIQNVILFLQVHIEYFGQASNILVLWPVQNLVKQIQLLFLLLPTKSNLKGMYTCIGTVWG